MTNILKRPAITKSIIIPLCFTVLFSGYLKAQDQIITIHLHGMYESKISLLPLTGSNALKPVAFVQGIRNGETTILQAPGDNLPGEFVLRFDYKEKGANTPYSCEKRIIIYNQDLHIRVNPKYCNNADSTWYQDDEKENTTYARFLKEINSQREMLGLLQNFLLNYDDVNSTFYQEGIIEYENRRKAFNQWITAQSNQNRDLFVSNLFNLYHIPRIDWKGSDDERKQSLRYNYFDEMDFSEPLMIKAASTKEWMDAYVNLYSELATSKTLRDSVFTLAGKIAIEKARTGHPLVYGWMVDYFFNGYESLNIQPGIKMLEPYLNDPNCLTSKRQSINKRLQGIEALVSGIIAPNIIMHDADNKSFDLYAYQTEKPYTILLFWSADCSHCQEMVGKLYPWYQRAEVQQVLDVVAISLDETGTEIQAWEQKRNELNGWIHIRAAEGMRSKVANDYYIVGIPVMVLLNTKTKEIIALPENTVQLDELLGF